MARRQVVLIGLLDEVPAQAQDAIQHALQQGANALDGTGVDPHPGKPAQGGGGQGGRVKGAVAAVRTAGSGRQGSGQGDGGRGQADRPTREPARAQPTPRPDRPEAHQAAQGVGGRSHAGGTAGHANRPWRRQPE